MIGGLPFVLIVVIGGLWVLRQAGRMDPRKARAHVLGWGAIALGLWLSVTHGIFTGLPVLAIGAGMLGYGNFNGFTPRRQSGNSAPPPPPARTNMDRNEAYDVLGLKPGATRDEINAAYKRLQRVNHPDTGGSTYLAAKINQARDLLLGN